MRHLAHSQGNVPSSAHNAYVDEEDYNPTKKELFKLLKPLFWPERNERTKRSHHFLRFLIIVSIVSLMIGKGLSALAPIFIGWCLVSLQKGERGHSIALLVGYILVSFIAVVFDEIRNFAYRYVQFRCINDLSLKLYEHIHDLNYNWFTNSKTGQVIRSIYRGCESMRELSQFAVVTLVPTLLESFVVIVLFFVIYNNFLLGFVLFAGLLVYFVFTVVVTNWRVKIRGLMNEKDNEMHNIANDSINNFETVKLFNNADHELNKYQKAVKLYELYNLKVLNSLSYINIGQELIRQATAFVCLLLSVIQIVLGKTDIGSFTVIQIYLFRIFRPLLILGTIYSSIIKSIVGLKDCVTLLNIKNTVKDRDDAVDLVLGEDQEDGNPLIEFRGVHFSYLPEKEPSKVDPASLATGTDLPVASSPLTRVENVILKNVSFKVGRNQKVAIVGPTGTGKTTVFRLLTRLYDPTRGQVLVNNRDLREYRQKSVRHNIGVVSQDTILFNDTIRNNVKYAKLDATDDEVWGALRMAEFHDQVLAFPDKLDTVVGERGIKLSGGEKQRISIARCFLKDPNIIILDEATSSLDSKTEAQIQNTLNSLTNRRTTLTIAHRLSTIVSSDLILVLSGGEIVEQGRHADLLKANGYYKSMWDVQSKSHNY